MIEIEIIVEPTNIAANAQSKCDVETNGVVVNGDAADVSDYVTSGNGVFSKEPNERDTFVKGTNNTCALRGEPRGTNSGFRRLFSDDKFRHRLLHTSCVFWSMVAMGWRVGLTGPTFPDLRQIINEDLSVSSWIFTAVSLGGLIGSVIAGLAYDRYNKLAVFTLIDVGLAATAAVTPWCHTFPLMFAAHLLHGGFVSALDTAATSDVVHVWGAEGGPYMQAVHFGFSLGAIISPFVSEPFLAKKLPRKLHLSLNSSSFVIYDKNSYNSTMIPQFTHAVYSNLTYTLPVINSTEMINTRYQDPLTDQGLPYVFEYGETKIYVTYLVSAVVSLSAACGFVLLFSSVGSVYKTSVVRLEQEKRATPAKYSVKQLLSKKIKVFFTCLIGTLLLVSVINERHFRDFLMTFAMTSLGWSKTKGSRITATFWIAYAAGRLSGIVAVKCLRQTSVFIMYISILTLGTFSLWLAVKYDVVVVTFASTALVGVGESVLFASCFSWLSENVLTVTGKMTSAMFIVFSSGAMTFPLLAGYLMNNYDPRWFVYLQIILVTLMNVILIVVIVVYRCVSRRNKR